MQQRLRALFAENGIDTFGFVPLDACTIHKPYLLERAGIADGSVAIFAIPYYTHACDNGKNISAYAVAKDYHLYFKTLAQKLLSTLTLEFPQNRFAAFADHSPIHERQAAAMAGLGIIGENGLLITQKYSSYVFLGEIITDKRLNCVPKETEYCQKCGLCQKNCPLAKGEVSECLSSLTQKKSSLSPTEEQMIKKYNCAWGCDLCQEICPHTKKAKQNATLYSPLSFFGEDTLPILTRETMLDMDDEAFDSRAYSWRGREVILRNLSLLENQNDASKNIENTKAEEQQFPVTKK